MKISPRVMRIPLGVGLGAWRDWGVRCLVEPAPEFLARLIPQGAFYSARLLHGLCSLALDLYWNIENMYIVQNKITFMLASTQSFIYD